MIRYRTHKTSSPGDIDVKTMLTREEALDYLRDVLVIQATSQSEPGPERLKLLNEIILRHHEEIPFQSISLLSVTPTERHRPTSDEIKTAVLTKAGGLCYTLNVFLFYLLRALGYETYLNISHVVSGASDNHVVVLVDNVVEDGDMYLAEVGCGYPTFRAISLNFDQESPIYQDLSLRYKFVKEGKTIKRIHFENMSSSKPAVATNITYEQGTRVFYEFEINRKAHLEYVDPCFDSLYSNIDELTFHRVIVARKFSRNKIIAVVNKKLDIDSGNDELCWTELEDEEDVARTVKKYFDGIDEETINKAVANWKLLRRLD